MRALARFCSFVLVALYVFTPVAAFAQNGGPSSSLTATPSSGSAPLSVQFHGVTPTPFVNYAITFGDGTSTSVYAVSDPGVSGGLVTATHTYQSAGTYTAKLLNHYPQIQTCPSNNPDCNVLAQTTVTVSGGSNGTKPACQMSVRPSVIPVGGEVTLSWQSQNAYAGSISGVGAVGLSGSIQLLPSSASATTFIGTFVGAGGTANCQATVQVSTSYFGGGGSGGSGGNLYGGGSTGGGDNSLGLGGSSGGGSGTSGENPTIQSANGGLVPCGTGGFTGDGADQNSSTGCQACNLAQLAQNIINFMIGVAIPVAALLFAWAGVLLFTSGASPGNRERAKSIFKNALIGFLIAIAAWLIINTFLHVLLGQGRLFTGDSWFTIQCTSARPVNSEINQLLNSVLPGINTTPNRIVSTGFQTYSAAYGSPCPQGYTVEQTLGYQCFNPDTGDILPPRIPSSALTCPDGYVIDPAVGGQCFNSQTGDIVPPSAPSSDSIASAIADGMMKYYGMDTSDGPDRGNKACAWAVNNILESEGIAPLDTVSVYNMEQALNDGRGIQEDQSQAQRGDIVIFGGMSHVGICYNDGCTLVLSNSSSNATFTSLYPPTEGSRIYRVIR